MRHKLHCRFSPIRRVVSHTRCAPRVWVSCRWKHSPATCDQSQATFMLKEFVRRCSWMGRESRSNVRRTSLYSWSFLCMALDPKLMRFCNVVVTLRDKIYWDLRHEEKSRGNEIQPLGIPLGEALLLSLRFLSKLHLLHCFLLSFQNKQRVI